jgi:2-phospho-L-lactate guanylyltransferase
MPTVVATADHDVVDWARARSVPALATGGESLDADATEAIDFLADHGVGAALIAHADLPRAQRLDHLVRSGTVVLVPDRAEDGTNVCLVPTDAGFRFAYGPGSFARHRAEAERLGLEVEIVVDDDLALDVDEPGHLAAASHLMPSVTAGI